MTSLFAVLALGAALAGLDLPAGAVRHSSPLASELAFVLSSGKSSYRVGEGLSLTFTVSSMVDFPVRASLDLNPLLGQAILRCRRDTAEFSMIPLDERHNDIAGSRAQPLNPGDMRRFTFTVAIADRFAPSRRFLLDQPGVYQCQVNYTDTEDDPNGLLQSNVITFNVTTPTGVDLEALGALNPEMACLEEVKTSCFVSPLAVSLADQFLSNHGTSIYAPAIRYGLRGHLSPRVRPRRATSEERAVWERHFTGDTIKPTLTISATPATLWPPNKKLVAVSMSVTASDNSGTPAIKLVSITCNDGCNASADVTGASFGTDDRSFKLRADRTGGGNGRTYVITYEATDAAGNKTTATSSVVVPHDQGHE